MSGLPYLNISGTGAFLFSKAFTAVVSSVKELWIPRTAWSDLSVQKVAEALSHLLNCSVVRLGSHSCIPWSPHVSLHGLAFSDLEMDNAGTTFYNFGAYQVLYSLDRPEKSLRSRTCELCPKHCLDKELLYFYKAIAGAFPSRGVTSSLLSSPSGYLVIISSWGTEEWRLLHLETAWDHRSPLLIAASQATRPCYSCAAL